MYFLRCTDLSVANCSQPIHDWVFFVIPPQTGNTGFTSEFVGNTEYYIKHSVDFNCKVSAQGGKK